MRNDLFTQVLDFSYVQIIKVPGEAIQAKNGIRLLEQFQYTHNKQNR